jgi:hypothetical protein
MDKLFSKEELEIVWARLFADGPGREAEKNLVGQLLATMRENERLRETIHRYNIKMHPSKHMMSLENGSKINFVNSGEGKFESLNNDIASKTLDNG